MFRPSPAPVITRPRRRVARWVAGLTVMGLAFAAVTIGDDGDARRAHAAPDAVVGAALAAQTAVRTFRMRKEFPVPPAGKLVFPVDPSGYCSLWIGSFGRTGSVSPTGRHEGTDIMVPGGNVVYAVEPGVLTRRYTGVGTSGSGFGWTLTGDSGVIYKYFHLATDPIGRVQGDRVERGDVIGYVGDTGTIPGNYHLHFEVRPNDSPIDPLPLLVIPSPCRVI